MLSSGTGVFNISFDQLPEWAASAAKGKVFLDRGFGFLPVGGGKLLFDLFSQQILYESGFGDTHIG